MPHDPEHVELARRHLAEGNARVARQRELLEIMQEHGYPTELAVELLNALTATLRQMQDHYDYLRAPD